MFSSRRPFRPRISFASVLPVFCVLSGCLFSSCSLGADGEKTPGAGNPVGGGNPPVGDTSHTGRGYYAFDFPAESSRLNLDSSYTIRWRAADSIGQGSVRIFLYRNDSLLGLLKESYKASGSFDWSFAGMQNVIGKFVGSGSGYRLRAVNEADSSKSDFSPLFSLYSDYAGSLVLTTPAAGAQVRGDSALRIAWTVSGKVGDVRLELWRDTLVWDLGTQVPASDGQFSWSIIPEWLPSGDGYRFRIYSTSDVSIEQMGPAFTLNLPRLIGAYEFLSPRSGDIWVAGVPGDLEWRVTGNPGSSSGLTLWRDSPREVVWGWTPGETHDYAGPWTVPSDLAGGTYRFRIGSLADTTLFAFSEAFTIRAAGSP